MNRELALKVADAVLYEGYMLYPYRPSALKNRQRWTFGILYPPGYDEVRCGTERAVMHSECVVIVKDKATLHVEARFLHLRAQEALAESGAAQVVDGRPVESCEEASARSVELTASIPGPGPAHTSFGFPAHSSREPRCDAGRPAATVERAQHEIAGQVAVAWEAIGENVFKLVIDLCNQSTLPGDELDRNQALLRSMLSVHAILGVEGGEFVSLLDPGEEYREAVSACRNAGNFPVLVGEPGARDMLLCSPILLYDYPQIAPESAGDFYDATEMDEMLTLRVMTMTADEKDEVRRAGEHVRNLLQRTEATAREQLQRTHGAIRSLRPVSESHD